MTRRGFTLIEMTMVVILIGIALVAVSPPAWNHACPGKASLTRDQIFLIDNEIRLFKLDNNRYPASLQELAPRYRDEVPLDAWNRPYFYRVPGTRGAFDLVSWGEDGKEGGEGVNADLWSHPSK